MLLKADVLTAAHRSVVPEKSARTRTLLLSPQGPCLTQEKAKSLARDYDRLVLVCGHYEGVDERFIELCVDEEVSIGDYVLTGGELPAMVLADVVTRLLPGVVGNEGSISNDSLEGGLLKYPQYTKPREFEGKSVPEVLLSGDHGAIEKWRKAQALERTKKKRPDLLKKLPSWIGIAIGLSLSAVGLTGCQTASKKVPVATAQEAKLIAQYDEDAVRAPKIQREVNFLFLRGRETRPTGWAFDQSRTSALEEQLKSTEHPDIQYFMKNREFFVMAPDSGGGFLIRATTKRLDPIRKSRAGHRKLFQIEGQQLRESIANPCFDELEDCGDLTSDALANEKLVRSYLRKYPGEDFADDRKKLVREIVRELEQYATRAEWAEEDRARVRQVVQASIARIQKLAP